MKELEIKLVKESVPQVFQLLDPNVIPEHKVQEIWYKEETIWVSFESPDGEHEYKFFHLDLDSGKVSVVDRPGHPFTNMDTEENKVYPIFKFGSVEQ